MIKRILFSVFISLVCFGPSRAQVGIGTATPNNSSILDLTSTSKGILIPRMTLSQRLAIPTPSTGLLVYQTDGAAGFWYYNGSSWAPFLTSTSGWTTSGNAGTMDTVNFIGTTDNMPFAIKVNNQNSGRIDHLMNNVFLGYKTGLVNTAVSNTFIGNIAGIANTSGKSNIMIGDSAGLVNNTGGRNVFIGFQAGASNTIFSNSTYIGYKAGSLANSSNCISIGAFAGYKNTAGQNCINIGYQAGYNASMGNNLFIGYQAGLNDSTGGNNHFIGYQAGYNNLTGTNNQFDGYKSGYSNTTGNVNTFIGQSAGYGNLTGSNNTMLGINAGYQNTTGSGNVFIGEEAGDVAYFLPNNANTTGSNNTFIGYKTGLGSTTQRTNATAIGYNALVDASNALVLGGTGANSINVGVNTTIPNARVDINGDMSIRQSNYTPSGGSPYHDIAVGSYSFIRITGTAGAFTIDGIAGGVDGKIVTLYNSTANNMTIANNTGSAAANQITTLTGGNIVTTGVGTVTLMYDATSSKWIVIATNL